MNIHFISIGGAVMHNMALAMHNLGNTVTGSDDEIFEPAYSRLKAKGLLPEAFGWFEEKITPELDMVILGMHARADNPELKKAKELGLNIYSFPEFLYEHSKHKTRVVIAGSHGKTTTTAMVMHALKTLKREFDYMVGSQLKGFDTMVQLSEAPLIVLEGDEYLNSALDPRPKFHFYHPHIAMITGIAWDHINAFPTFDNYLEQFRIFVNQLPDGAPLVYYDKDEHLHQIANTRRDIIKLLPYTGFETAVTTAGAEVIYEGRKYPMQVFGSHNFQNMHGAMLVCAELGISPAQFLEAMQSFEGTAKRLELVLERKAYRVYRDFAHSPSKVKATVQAVKEQFAGKKIHVFFELHTFSSLNENFLDEYKDSMSGVDTAVVYYNAHVFELKRMKMLEPQLVEAKFGSGVEVITDTAALEKKIHSLEKENAVFLMMSSGSFDKLDFESVFE